MLLLADDGTREAVSGVLKSWLVFVQVLCLDWLTAETCTRTELRDVCIGALLGSLRPLLDEDPAPDWSGRPRATAPEVSGQLVSQCGQRSFSCRVAGGGGDHGDLVQARSRRRPRCGRGRWRRPHQSDRVRGLGRERGEEGVRVLASERASSTASPKPAAAKTSLYPGTVR